ncbi:Os01g0818200, partial [Oryza sativa Japonica Group]
VLRLAAITRLHGRAAAASPADPPPRAKRKGWRRCASRSARSSPPRARRGRASSSRSTPTSSSPRWILIGSLHQDQYLNFDQTRGFHQIS